MATYTAKEVKPSTEAGKPTVIITDDGSKMSGFDAGLKTMLPGTVYKAETEVKKGYVNIVSYEIISVPGGGPAAAAAAPPAASPAKIASDENIARAHDITQLWVGDALPDDDPDSKILKDKLKGWLKGLPSAPDKAPAKAQAAETKKAEEKPADIIFVTNAKELMQWAAQHGKQYTPSWVRKEGNLEPDEPISDKKAVEIYEQIKDAYGWK